jgi:cytochrome c-type biogenesis protein CcmH
MLPFILIAATLTLFAMAIVVVPLLRPGTATNAPAPWAALASIAVLLVGGAGLYALWSNWSWSPAAPAAESPAAMVASLARRLEKEPDDLDGWLMLGRSYVVLQQLPLAMRAYGRADRLAGGANAEALIGLGEVLVMQDEQQLTGQGGAYFERALAIDPTAGKALFFGGVAALRRGELPVARERFVALLAQGPPDNIRPLLEQQVAAIDAEAAGGAAPATVVAAPSGAPAASTGAGADARDATIHVNITIAPALAASVPSGAPLFVLARDPAAPGPPLAVKRLAATFPQRVTLTTADAMMPGREIAAGKTVQVVARIARSGTPQAASGDAFGELSYDVGRDGLREIVIDRVTP